MSATASAKDAAMQIIQQLPNEATPDEIVAELYFRQKVAAGLQDLDRNCSLTHEEAKARLAKWLS
jgi:hypothetical protein